MPYSDPEKQKAAQARYYQENKAVYAKQQRDRRSVVRKYIVELKTASVCVDCLIDYPHYILQFDHITGDKIGDVSKLARTGNLQLVKDEIAKCEIVCANCHWHRTFMRSAGRPITDRL
jgi:hypothetical protein